MRIIVLSDTHIPRAANDLPAEIYTAIDSADMVLHAGDFVEKDLYDRLKKRARLIAVCGNMDTAELHATLKPKEIVDVEGVRIGLIHGHGPARDLTETIRKEFAAGKVNAIVFGHSHTACNEERGGILLFNPGSPTDRIFAAANSYGMLTVANGTIKGEIIPVSGVIP